MKHIYIIVLLTLTNYLQVHSQEKTFNAGALLGLNIASLPNDDNDYIGLNTGIFCDAKINNHYSLKIEMLYSQNGEYILPQYYPHTDYGKIRLDHIEIPLHFDFYINSYKYTSSFPDWTLELGIAYTRLFDYYAEDRGRNNITDQVIYDYTDTFLLQLGTTIYLTDHIGCNIRFSKPLKNNILEITGALRLTYRF